MKNSFESLRARVVQTLGLVALFAGCGTFALAQKPEARILAPVDNAARAALTGTRTRLAEASSDGGRMAATTQLQQMTIVFSRSAAQQAALDALIAAQQNPASAQFHQWLEPDQFAAQFGAADADIAKVETWLASQGFTVGEVSRNRSEIAFSGSVAQVEAAFGTEMHYFTAGGATHFGPALDLSVPAAFSSAVMGVGHVSDWKPRAHSVKVNPHFTSSQTGSNFVQPGDVSVIYDIQAAYSAGYTGSGQTIAVIGQSAVTLSDISNFQTAAGVPVRSPSVVLMPGTGASTFFTGDQSESDLDLEYSSGIAKGANILFVYTGNGNYGAFDAMVYAITNRLAPIISISYGSCEPNMGQTNYNTYNGALQQAAAQGQTVIASAGDSGSTDCYGDTNLSTATQSALSADFPASSQYVTGMGGTEYLAADVAKGNTQYWQAQSTSDIVASAKSYIPEQVWNDDAATSGLSSGGGGASQFTAQPSWQTGVPGITAGSFRLVPDIALASSPNNAGYLYCSSDTANTGITGSCSNGFRDVNNTNLTVVGGTSVATPIFAGMLAIINQKTNTSYAGVANVELYKLASNSATYASAFHDITSGSNGCISGTLYPLTFNANGSVATYGPACPSASAGQYAATTGYDEATGLGSVDLYNLMQAWPNNVPLTGSTTTVTPATLTPVQAVGDVITFKVASASSGVTTTPTGTINLSVDGTYVQALTLTGGTATYTFTSSTLGAHVISGVYTGDTVFSTSTGTATVTVISSNSTTTLAAATTPATSGTADVITITVGGAGVAPTGTVNLTVDGTAAGSVTLTPGTTTSTATYSFVASAPGSHTIAAAYQGNGVYQQSGATLTLAAKSPGSFTLAAAAVTVSAGTTTTATVNVTPTGGYTGLTNLTLSPATIANACYSLTNPTISGTAAVPVTVTIYTNGTNCSTQNLIKSGSGKLASHQTPARPGMPVPAGLAMAGLLAIGLAGRRNRKLRGLVAVAVMAVAGFAMSGCGSTSTAGAGISTLATKGAYTVTVTGADAVTGTITSTTTFTLTIQ